MHYAIIADPQTCQSSILRLEIKCALNILAIWGNIVSHDDVIKLKNFPRYWPFARWIRWSPVDSPHKGQWHRALMFSLICAWTNGSANNRNAGYLRRHRPCLDVTVTILWYFSDGFCVWHVVSQTAAWKKLRAYLTGYTPETHQNI